MIQDPLAPPDNWIECHPNDNEHGMVPCDECDGTGWLYTEQDKSDLEHMQELLKSRAISLEFRMALAREIKLTSREEMCPNCSGRGEVLV